MAGVEEKLASFSKIVLEMANKQRDGINERIEEEIDSRVGDMEKEFTENARGDMEKEVLKRIRENNEKILKTESDLKRRLLLKRENIINEIFGNVESRIEDFIESKEYGKWLEAHARAGIRELGGENCVLYIMKKDEKYKKELENLTGCSAELSEQNFLGGVKIYSKNRCVDYSLTSVIEQAQNVFLKNTDLSVG